jgi:hypothetical protein
MDCYSYVFGAFEKFQRVTVRFVMPDRPHGATQLPLHGLTWNLIFEHFLRIRQENAYFIKIGQE